MKMNANFEALVKQLDHDALEQLRKSVVLEIEGREDVREGVPIDSIRRASQSGFRPSCSLLNEYPSTPFTTDGNALSSSFASPTQ